MESPTKKRGQISPWVAFVVILLAVLVIGGFYWKYWGAPGPRPSAEAIREFQPLRQNMLKDLRERMKAEGIQKMPGRPKEGEAKANVSSAEPSEKRR